jgi:hypothetical protein
VLAHIWIEAMLLQPAICVIRMSFGPRDPTIVIVLLGAGAGSRRDRPTSSG